MMWETTFKEMVSLSSFEDNHDIYYSSVRLPFPITDRGTRAGARAQSRLSHSLACAQTRSRRVAGDARATRT
jgi:hypothetical protein